MRLSFNEIRARAAQFAESWADATYEKGETQSFYNDFFGVFGVERRSVARYEEHVKKLDNRSGFIDLFWPKVLLVEQKSAGRDLAKAGTQAGEYFDALKPADRPRFQLLCDFQTFQLLDRDTREETTFALADLPAHVEKFGFIMGMEKRSFKDQDPVNIEAAELVGHLHDALEASGYTGHRLEVFLTRIVFCLFADDTGIFEPRDIFLEFIEARTKEDGSDLGALLNQLFEVLDTPEDTRQSNLDEDLARFPYVNGSLFADPIRTPAFDSGMRARLIEAARFNWSGISPAIFGSLFQSVMNREERRKAGAHYTTEKNIMKVIGPLFLDGLRAEFDAIQARKTQRRKLLEAFQDKLAGLTFLDPACGCGNFLIITYRELRLLEIEVAQGPARDGPARARRAGAQQDRRGPVLRDRVLGVPRADRRDGDVDDGPHHECAAQPRVRPGVPAHPAAQVAVRSPMPTRWSWTGRSCCRPSGAATSSATRPSWALRISRRFSAAAGPSHRRFGEVGGTLDYVAAGSSRRPLTGRARACLSRSSRPTRSRRASRSRSSGRPCWCAMATRSPSRTGRSPGGRRRGVRRRFMSSSSD